jgi:transcriptional regulator with XRE-family HTH domain
MPERSSFGAMVRLARARLGVTLAYVSQRAGCSTSFVSDVEHDRRSVSPAVAVRLAKALSHSPERFVERVLQDWLDGAGVALDVRVEARRAGVSLEAEAAWLSDVRTFVGEG